LRQGKAGTSFLGLIMKEFLFVVLVVVFGGGGIFYLTRMRKTPKNISKVPQLDQSSKVKTLDKGKSLDQATIETAIKKREATTKPSLLKGEIYGADVKRLWAKLRPPEEALVPDPDHVGPCPPPSDGGHPALVIRRYKEQGTGYFVWIHEDGAKTVVSPDPVDLGASLTSPGARGYTITTMVPTQAASLSPDDDRKN